MENQIIQIKNLTKRFAVGTGEFTALQSVDLSIGKGEFMGLVGPSGSGKTTLLNIIGSLDVPSEGEVNVMGRSISGLSHKKAAELRNYHIGFIFQSYNLLPVYTVYENVEFALLLQKLSASERKKSVMEALDWVGLTSKAKSKPAQLSGGESQRVSIARAMVKRPDIVLADEPSANLDSKNSHHIVQTMKKLNEELNTTFIFSTHDEKVMQYLNRIVSMKDGAIEKESLIHNS
ncbi:ABC transporter ATP-binding protein [Aurantibacillus circumpalustris]|uniref:ABC transporter ATP-binding protein n=1 Tax=Aurantibacillus circumpalustris TaxID=3036359 RepID=UPI00295B83BC|nr:ABC transporter ATP-binding protein [Aurantibacillus circumpalustris]